MEKNLTVLYEDNHVIVVLKPQNILSQSDITKDEDLLSMVKAYVKEKYNKQGEAFIGLVHRLDRPTGGVMVFARNSKSASRLSTQIVNHQFDKRYLAVCEGVFKHKTGRLENYLKKDEKTNLVKLVPLSESGAKLAVLEYKVLCEFEDKSLVEVKILTGRSHQIRVQLANLKHPLVGDLKYGSTSAKAKNLALWAYNLEFEHPTKKSKMKFKSLPPKDEYPWSLFNLEKFIWNLEMK